jgi:DNA-binding transcriptional LysR family regulator
MPEGVKTIPLLADPPTMIARRGHPALRSSLSLSAFARLPQISVVGGTQINDALRQFGLERRIALRAPSMLYVPIIFEMTDLVAIAPMGMVSQFSEAYRLGIQDPALAAPVHEQFGSGPSRAQ